jgi:hypothetical protein
VPWLAMDASGQTQGSLPLADRQSVR